MSSEEAITSISFSLYSLALATISWGISTSFPSTIALLVSRLITPENLSPEPMGIEIGATLGVNFSFKLSSTLSKSAFSLSMRLMKIIDGFSLF
ncbi:hypothetical protein ES707_22967 [subsurface metagenome]